MRLRLEPLKKFLTLSKRPTIWTRDFTLALGTACALHFIAAFFFSIDLGVMPQSSLKRLHHVKAEAPFFAEALFENQPFVYRNLPPLPRSAKPLLASIPIASGPNPAILKTLLWPKDSFEIATSESLTFEYSSPQLHFSRGLSIKNAPTLDFFNPHPLKASLQFQASSQSGMLVWLKWIESTGDPILDRNIERYLKNVRLNIPAGPMFIKGEVELLL